MAAMQGTNGMASSGMESPRQNGSMPPPPMTSSPAQRPMHSKRPSTASSGMQRAKQSSNRIGGDAFNDRNSNDEETRTAVKVVVRVRPPLRPTDPGFDLVPPRFRESTCDVSTPTSLSVESPHGKKLFVFDRVFGEDTTQDDIWEYLSDSVSSFVKGYNVSILAYGQSGSGKSYTMGTSGPEDQEDPKIMGIVPRAARLLFEKLNGAPARQSALPTPKRYSAQVLPTMASLARLATNGGEKDWSLKATYVEIYQEQLRDLLVPESTPLQDRAQVAIREDNKGRILVTGLTQVTINSVEDLLNALNSGSSIRQTDSTNINARSSRSHAVFSLNLVQKKTDGRSTTSLEKRRSMPAEALSGAENVVTIDSKLHFVDLAGSERMKNTGATGDRAKEGISINAGLASLGKVISQLSSKQSGAHISYRDSRLTRLLQDSLGGNAITFMVACVTPAVFHLSETLNTVHYAQRARAIQSKPEIQQTREESDKQAAIDRLRAEVSFLRDQIRHSERGDSKGFDSGRSGRGREAELQVQLMDMQENYNSLSSRHAKLIADLSKARDGENEVPLLNGTGGENAMERVKRSSSFAEAVEQMVMEYEKTIQTLESSLSKTRSSLSNSESTLLEKETRLAYMSTIQQQLQVRIQKALEREENNESYLRDLETQMEGTVSGEEKNATLMTELRREIARMRESENSAEDYISTLEERLADAEQDQDIMQREIDRLEHVIERQRSIGRLDNLLGELDGVRTLDPQASHGTADVPQTPQRKPATPRISKNRESYDPYRPQSDADGRSESEFSPEEKYEDAVGNTQVNGHGDGTFEDALPTPTVSHGKHTPQQQDLMADKIETMSQELFELRSEHESVVFDYDKLQQKYQTALETLAKLEYGKPAFGTDNPFLADAGMRGEDGLEVDGQPLSSQSLLAGSSSQQHGRTSSLDDLTEKLGSKNLVSDEVAAVDGEDAAQHPLPEEDEDAGSELEVLRRLHAEKEVSVAELTENYKSLHARHEATMAQVDDLKYELARAQNFRPQSPGFSKHFVSKRRSEDLMGISSDRASRASTSLKNIALYNFEQNPDTRQTFELNLNTVLAELQTRSSLVQSLEAELATMKKDLDTKQTIISGLSRERASLKASSANVDFSVVGQMRDQLTESENQIRSLHEQHATKEKEFQDQIDNLKATLAAHSSPLPTSTEEQAGSIPGAFEETPARGLNELQATGGAEQEAEVAKLRTELDAWEVKHKTAMDGMQASEAKLLSTIADLEKSLRNVEHDKNDGAGSDPSPWTTGLVAGGAVGAAALGSLEVERAKHHEVVAAMQREIDEYREAATGHTSKMKELEGTYTNILEQVDEHSRNRELSDKELVMHRDLVANLENQLQVHKNAVQIHQESLESLQASHSEEMDNLRTSMLATERESTAKYAALQNQHIELQANMQTELSKLQSEKLGLLRSASSALGYETDSNKLHSQIKGLVEEGKELHTRHLKTTSDLKAVQEELQNALNNTVELENKISELKMINEETILNLEKVTEREKKSSRLVDELEEQLNNNFDSHKAANNRLSSMQGEVLQQRMELERELEDQKMRNALLEQQIAAFQRQSTTSNHSNHLRDSLSPEAAAIALARSGSSSSQVGTRKSTGPTALPTPPPSIPLPPLPGNDSIEARATSPPPLRTRSPMVSNVSPPGSRHASKDVNLGHTAQLEEQESRIRTIEKHLFAEKQLTATLEEALVDLETSANRTKGEMDAWRRKCQSLEDELVGLRKERNANSRVSLQVVEEEREMRLRAEKARQALEQRMMELNSQKKKKKNALNCF